ncbi:hypothetical protein Tco_1093743 [Tanacetum coccineum]|uniref:Uncharacterized protein n=1 Tax=Tanacetum coccineum TaxID=301880 RepID=A0ABQ5IDK7_9ASTR
MELILLLHNPTHREQITTNCEHNSVLHGSPELKRLSVTLCIHSNGSDEAVKFRCLLVLNPTETHNAQPISMVRSTPSQYIPRNKATPVIAWLRKKSEKEKANPKTPTPLHTMKNKEIRHSWSEKT